MKPTSPGTVHAREQLLKLAQEGHTVYMEDREPWRIGELAEDYRQSAVLILFGALDQVPSEYEEHGEGPGRDLDVLLVQRSANLRSHPGQVAFPGGRLDPPDGELGELMTVPGGEVSAPHVRGALREAHEETGLDPDAWRCSEPCTLFHCPSVITWLHPSSGGGRASPRWMWSTMPSPRWCSGFRCWI
ncbi:NUDIX domain-containing protein [Kocuria atrinae]|uniref:NUDIX domain-containing protein n=1 Tax=Kocuria atrinae TaxID=592377 RepID=UPI0002FEAFDA|nr:NUDIX domain-containing protein [Kocuria atrinae]